MGATLCCFAKTQSAVKVKRREYSSEESTSSEPNSHLEFGGLIVPVVFGITTTHPVRPGRESGVSVPSLAESDMHPPKTIIDGRTTPLVLSGIPQAARSLSNRISSGALTTIQEEPPRMPGAASRDTRWQRSHNPRARTTSSDSLDVSSRIPPGCSTMKHYHRFVSRN